MKVEYPEGWTKKHRHAGFLRTKKQKSSEALCIALLYRQRENICT